MKYLALFTSLATLSCCAIPALLVLLGLGSAVASMVSTFPFLVTLSEHKLLTFGISFLCIASAALGSRYSRSSCPSGPNAAACASVKRSTPWILLCAALLWFVGFSVAFILPKL